MKKLRIRLSINPSLKFLLFFQSKKPGGDHIFEYRKSVIDDLFSTEKYKLYTPDTNHGVIV